MLVDGSAVVDFMNYGEQLFDDKALICCLACGVLCCRGARAAVSASDADQTLNWTGDVGPAPYYNSAMTASL